MAIRGAFIPDPDFADGEEARAACEAKAEEVVEAAKEIAPVGGPYPPSREAKGWGDPGSYRDGIRVTSIDEGVWASAYDFKSFWIEMGTGEPYPTPAFAPLRNGCDAAGLELSDEEDDADSG